jgi:hypothetical protein
MSQVYLSLVHVGAHLRVRPQIGRTHRSAPTKMLKNFERKIWDIILGSDPHIHHRSGASSPIEPIIPWPGAITKQVAHRGAGAPSGAAFGAEAYPFFSLDAAVIGTSSRRASSKTSKRCISLSSFKMAIVIAYPVPVKVRHPLSLLRGILI